MSKIVDITDKLSFEENPKIVIKGREYEVQSDAATVLKLMAVLGDSENITPKDVVTMYELLFSEEDMEAIESSHLPFKDFQTLVMTAVQLITGEETEQGE